MEQNEFDHKMMRRALELARNGIGHVSPNPLVGAIVTDKDGEVIGEGWHEYFGGPHGEVNALAAAAGHDLTEATLYITLEPCNHQGKTPPCTEAILESGVRRVVVAMRDPNPLVSGRGNRRLREAGIEVTDGIMEAEAKRLNEAYIHFIKTGSPFVTVKVAQSLDGYIALPSGESQWITGELARERVHRIRAASGAVVVGTRTALTDNPSLTVRHGVNGRNPRRIVIDRHLQLPSDLKLFTDEFHELTTVMTGEDMTDSVRAQELQEAGVAVVGIPVEPGTVNIRLDKIIEVLGNQQVASVMVEGGAALIDSLIEQNLAHKIIFFIAPKLLGHGIKPFGGLAREKLADVLSINVHKTEMVGEDVMITGYFQNT